MKREVASQWLRVLRVDLIPQQGSLRIVRLVFNHAMKRLFLILAACTAQTLADLPQMSDKKDWLGYFTGWEGRGYDFGIGADGKGLIFPKAKGKRTTNKEIQVRYLIEEEVKGRWVRREIIKEDGLKSENEKGLNPKKTIVFDMTVTGGTKIQWTHSPARGAFSIKPKLLEKKTENKIRVGIEFVLPRLYRFDEVPEGRELRKKLGRDYVKGTRLKDGKKVRVKFSDLKTDIRSEDILKEGASEVEVKSEALAGKALVVKNGSAKSGNIEVVTRGALYESLRFVWRADPEKISDKETYVTFSLE